MMEPLTGIAIIRCQLSEEVCRPEEWKKYINDSSDFRDFCVKKKEIIVTLLDCKGCQKNKDKAKEIKTKVSQLAKHGINTIFLTRCMCRNISELRSCIGIRSNNLSWVNKFASFCWKGCIGTLEKELASDSCILYQGQIIEKCPNKTASHLLKFVKDNYPSVNMIIKE